MAKEPAAAFVELDLSIHIFTVSATLVGVCLTVIGIMRHIVNAVASRYGQELIALDALLFLICCILSFAALKMHSHHALKKITTTIADNLFIVALTLMTIICGIVVFEVN